MNDATRPPRTALIQSPLLKLILWFGLAITLPIPGRHQLILARRVLDEPEKRHEFAHCWQIVDWGWWRYLWRHAVARVQARSFTAPLSDVEFPCYKIQYPEMSDTELAAYLRGD